MAAYKYFYGRLKLSKENEYLPIQMKVWMEDNIE